MNIIKRACTGSGRGQNLPGRFAPGFLFRKPPFFFPGYAPADHELPTNVTGGNLSLDDRITAPHSHLQGIQILVLSYSSHGIRYKYYSVKASQNLILVHFKSILGRKS